MNKKGSIVVIGVVLASVVIAVSSLTLMAQNPYPDTTPGADISGNADGNTGMMHDMSDTPGAVDTSMPADVIMPTKSSRPGCEIDDRCYIPHVITVSAGHTVSWLNDDSAFHSVTSGTYGAPTILFDSGYMDPAEIFTYTFDQPGTYPYFCTLHEWMVGTIIVR